MKRKLLGVIWKEMDIVFRRGFKMVQAERDLPHVIIILRDEQLRCRKKKGKLPEHTGWKH